MIQIQENKNLLPYNTFGIAAQARYFCTITTEADLLELLATEVYANHRYLILGGGSNVLFVQDFDGLVIKNELKGIREVDQDDHTITLQVMGGEIWHDLVLYCVHHQYGGIENLSLIPGTVGAAPIQNIGAYGVEIKEVINQVAGIDLLTRLPRTFTNQQCEFGYRDSTFKHAWKEKFFISSVTLTLTRNQHHFNLRYGALSETLHAVQPHEVSLQMISDAVIRIRQSKLPDPAVIGNAGSFFKNPTIAPDHFEELKKQYPNIPGYQSENQQIKVPAGWLIEQCGWKGKRMGAVGVHHQQALVIVNHGAAHGQEILDLAHRITSSVQQQFQIALIPEVNIISG